ncbi:MAG: alpha/beta fold hydrolase [Cellvibrionaceae bacterium]
MKSHRSITKLGVGIFSFCRLNPLRTPLIIMGVLSVCISCSSPVNRLQHQAEQLGLKEKTVQTTNNHLIKSYYSKSLEEKLNNQLVFVYLEGDGRPWSKRMGPNNDPNTHQSVVLPLLIQAMNETKEAGIYLSRPCYGIDPMPENCNQKWWTSHRYSKQVVDEMDEALTQLKNVFNIEKMVLVGHSGGGALAMLLANKRKHNDEIEAVITLAGNLDHTTWTNYFHYLPLHGSLNVIDEPPLPSNIIRWHFAGNKDTTVPIEIIREVTQKDEDAKLIELENVDHTCCWHSRWYKTITDIKEAISVNNQ